MTTLEEALVGITDVRTLKSKRGARRGNLNRQSNHYQATVDLLLDLLNLQDLEKRLEAVEENIAAYKLIQDRLEEVAETDALSGRGDRNHGTVEVQQWARRGLSATDQGRPSLEHWEDEVKDLTGCDNLSGNYARLAYEQLVVDFKDFRQDIKRIPRGIELQSMKDQLGPALEDLRGRIDRELTTATTPDSSVSSKLSEKLADLAVSKRSRLRLELPTFSGNILQWRDFWSPFSPLIEREGLQDREKIAHLIVSLRD